MAAADAPERPPRIRVGELISAGSALILLVCMFGLEWFGVVGPAGRMRSGINSAEDAWNGLTVVRWLMLLTIVAALGSVILHATQRAHGTKTDTSLIVTGLGTLTALLLIYRVLLELPAPNAVVDVKLGGFLGLLSAIGIALGGYESIREQRARTAALSHRSRPRSRVASAPHPR